MDIFFFFFLFLRVSVYTLSDINSVLGLLHCVAVGYVTNISEVHNDSIFRVKSCRLVNCCVCTAF
jgi:hypothetical protein